VTGRPTLRCSICGGACVDDDRVRLLVPARWTIEDLRARRFEEMTVIEATCAACGERPRGEGMKR
jgi:hypothetical protein